MSLVNYYKQIPKNLLGEQLKYYNPRANALPFEHPMMLCILGATGIGHPQGGKTTIALNLINMMNCFDVINVFCSHPEEALYQFLQAKGDEPNSHIHITVTDDLSKLKPAQELDSKLQNLFLFDDIIHLPKDVQTKVWHYVLAIRKKNGSVWYIAPSFFKIPKEIRDNFTKLILKGVNNADDRKNIFKKYRGSATMKQMEDMYAHSDRDGSFFTINVIEHTPNLRFLDGFLQCYQIE